MPINPHDEKLENRIEKLQQEIDALRLQCVSAHADENRFRAVFDSMDEIYFEVNLEGDLIYFNPALCRLTGYTPDELMKKNHREYTSPETAKRMYKIFNQVYRTGKPAKITNHEISVKGGEARILELSAYLIRDEKGSPVGFRGLGRDITQRLASEKALREREERLRRFTEASFAGVMLHDGGKILDCNAELVRMTGYTHEELVGMDGLNLCAPEYRKKIMDAILSGDEKPYDVVGVRKDGRRIPIEIRARSIPYQGKTIRAAEFRDITEQKKAEEALRKSRIRYRKLYKETQKTEELYQSLLNFSADAIVLLNTHQNVQFLNPAFTKIFGWTLEELQGRNIPFTPKPLEASMSDLFHRMITIGDSVHGLETQRYTKDKRLLDVSLSASRYLSDTGEPAGIFLILRDVSEAKRYQWHMEQTQKMEALGTLAGRLAHDFNNLLMGMQGRLSLLLLNMDPSGSYYKHLKEIEDYVIRAADLAHRLLDIARKERYEPRPVDLCDLIRNQNRLFGRTRKEIEIAEDFVSNLFTVEADPRQIEQVLLNIYLNASHAMPNGGRLFIKTQNVDLDSEYTEPYGAAPGKYVKVSITDNGIGMDEATRKRVFEPFFTTKARGHGTGLGLSAAYNIIKNHGGFITLYSEKGEGSTFNLYLPASEKALKAEDTASHEKIVEGEGTILLVDDEEMIREIGREMITTLGYQALVAAGGEEALRVYKEKNDQIDLVILDLIMPKMSGTETFDRLRALNPKARILLSSGYSINGQADSVMKRGCNGFIQKPFNLKELSCKINEIIGFKTPQNSPSL